MMRPLDPTNPDLPAAFIQHLPAPDRARAVLASRARVAAARIERAARARAAEMAVWAPGDDGAN